MEPDALLCSRNARPEKDGEGAARCLLARRTRTVKLCSFDARSEGQPWPLLPRKRLEWARTVGDQTRAIALIELRKAARRNCSWIESFFAIREES